MSETRSKKLQKFNNYYKLQNFNLFKISKVETNLPDHKFLSQFDKCRKGKLFFSLDNTPKIINKSSYASNAEFSKKVKRCLLLLKKKAPKYYKLFMMYNVPIHGLDDLDNTCANLKDRIIQVCESHFYEDDPLFAAGLIHEVIHFWQYESGAQMFYKFSPKNGWQENTGSNQLVEIQAIKFELDALKLLNGSKDDIEFVEKQRGLHWQPYHQ